MSSDKKWEEEQARLRADPGLSVKQGTITVGGNKVYYREGASSAMTKPKGALLFLHGQSFKSQTWHDLGTLHFMANAGYRPLAIDLPGYGDTKRFDYQSSESFLLEVKAALGLKDIPVILISPSMSGGFAIPFLFSNPEEFKGYLPVAPVSTGCHTHDEYAKVKVPTCIVYGEKDKSLGVSSFQDLSKIPNREVHVLKGAGHAAYMNSPAVFHQILVNFADKLFT